MMTQNKPGVPFIRPDTYQDPPVLGAAAAIIGPQGGVVRVSDPKSALFGISLEIPAGALDAHELVRIEEGSHACAFGLAPSVNLLPEGLRFNRPVEVKMCFDPASDTPAAFYVYDEGAEDWALQEEAAASSETGIARCLIWHL